MHTPGRPQVPVTRHSWAERDRLASLLLHRAAARRWVVVALSAVSRLSDGVVWYSLIVALPWLDPVHGTACALRMLCLGMVDLVIYKIIKRHVARPRPFVACADIRACARPLDEHSFPSGHTLHAVGFGVLLIAYYPATLPLVIAFVAMVGLSRVVLGLHYASDVLAGAVIGVITAEAVLVLF